MLKVQLGPERGLLVAIRKIEDGLNSILYILNDENWDTTPDNSIDAISSAWDKVHELLAVIQPWRNVNAQDKKAEDSPGIGEGIHTGGASRGPE